MVELGTLGRGGVCLTRRELLRRGRSGILGLAGGLVVLPIACSKDERICVDPDFLSTPERALRTSQGYADRSPHGHEKSCSGCQFFTQEGEVGCGRCQILGGPVSSGGHCNAWARAAARTESA